MISLKLKMNVLLLKTNTNIKQNKKYSNKNKIPTKDKKIQEK